MFLFSHFLSYFLETMGLNDFVQCSLFSSSWYCKKGYEIILSFIINTQKQTYTKRSIYGEHLTIAFRELRIFGHNLESK